MKSLLRHDNLHSRLVAGLKILLPLTALAILSTLFLVSNKVNPEDAIPYADVDIADRLREPRLTDAAFAGMTQDGAALTIRAAEAVPGQSGTADAGLARKLSGVLETPDGAKAVLLAAEARLNGAARLLMLSGGVIVTTSGGYRIETSDMAVALDRTDLRSDTAIVATGPMGSISAGSMHLAQAEGSGPDYLLVFNQGVRLIYLPPKY